MKNSPLASQQNKQEKAPTTSNPATSTALAPSGILLSTAMIQRAQQDPRALSSQDVLALQRTIGNRAVANLVQSKRSNAPTLQPKLQVGPAHDRYEAEADHIANQVVQRQPDATHEPILHVQQQSVSGKNAKRPPTIQRFSDKDAKPGAKTNWLGETTQIKKSAAGSVTGVFFVSGGGGGSLVIKPEYQDGELEGRPTTAAQSQFADKTLSKLGFFVPNSRIVWPGDDEFQEIVQILNSQLLILKPEDEEQRGAIGARLANAK